jgi:hypothetical protein
MPNGSIEKTNQGSRNVKKAQVYEGEGKFRQQIKSMNFDVEVADRALPEAKMLNLIAEAKGEFYPAVRKARDMGDYKEIIEFGFKWFGE